MLEPGNLVVFDNPKTHWEYVETKLEEHSGGIGVVQSIYDGICLVWCHHLQTDSWGTWWFSPDELIKIDHFDDFDNKLGDFEETSVPERIRAALDAGDWGCQERSVRSLVAAIVEWGENGK